MNRIKIIKRADASRICAVEEISERAAQRRAIEGRRKAANAVTEWIGELREQKRKDAETASAALFRFKSLSQIKA
jgi:Holliday junction resolvasome RuvABC DNA-binding subunit